MVGVGDLIDSSGNQFRSKLVVVEAGKMHPVLSVSFAQPLQAQSEVLAAADAKRTSTHLREELATQSRAHRD